MLNLLLETSVYIAFSTVGFLLGYIYRGSVQRWRDAEERHKQMTNFSKEQYRNMLKTYGDIQE